MSGSVALLDVNLLVALFDQDHIHHEVAHDWFADNRAGGWATCPLTENGLVRVLANPAYGSAVSALPELVGRLKTFTASGRHEFWTDDVSLLDGTLFKPASMRGHRHVTDAYLLGLAHRRGGRLATLDQSIPLAAIPGVTRATLEVISAAADYS